MNLFYKILACLFVFFFSFSFSKAIVQAPLGGRILLYPIPGITCPGNTSAAPFSIQPYNVASPLPYTPVIENLAFKIRPSVYFKGNYLITPLPICFTDTPIPVPVPTFPVTFYSTSQLPF